MTFVLFFWVIFNPCNFLTGQHWLKSNIGNKEGPKKNAGIALDALLFSLEEYIYQDMADAA